MNLSGKRLKVFAARRIQCREVDRPLVPAKLVDQRSLTHAAAAVDDHALKCAVLIAAVQLSQFLFAAVEHTLHSFYFNIVTFKFVSYDYNIRFSFDCQYSNQTNPSWLLSSEIIVC